MWEVVNSIGSIASIIAFIYGVWKVRVIPLIWKVLNDLYQKGHVRTYLIIQNLIHFVLVIYYFSNRNFSEFSSYGLWTGFAHVMALVVFMSLFAIWYKNEPNQKGDLSARRIRKIQHLWFVALNYWIYLYFFAMYSYDNHNSAGEIPQQVIRNVVNLGDSALFLALFALFRSSEPSISLLRIFNYNFFLNVLIIGIFCTVIGVFITRSHPEILSLTMFLGSILSAITFVLFFGKLDSIFIDLPKFYLIIIYLYALLQIFFPYFIEGSLSSKISGPFRFSKEAITLGMVYGGALSIFAKLILTRILLDPKYADGIKRYFTVLFTPKY